MIVGVLVAAGRGRRMGGSKQLLPWTAEGAQAKPLVAAAFDAVSGACDEMVVVLGHEAEAVAAALAPRAYRAVRADADAEMLESIRAGLAAARAIDASASVLLHPADHPEVAAGTLAAILAAHESDPDRAVMPEHAGRGGHPVLIPAGLIDRLMATHGDGGLRRYWIEHPGTRVRVRVDDASAVRDIDRPGD
jgi:CTP:molybdopterin cytidylyltransferase MocA